MWLISNYNNDLSWVSKYTDDYVVYDQSGTSTLPNTVKRPHGGSDIYDKLSYIVDNYDSLPDVLVMIKGNLFKYITEEEFIQVKDNKTFTPLLTKNHKVDGVVNFYSDDGMYNERNDYWYLLPHPCRSSEIASKLKTMLGFDGREYLRFAPGSNYIVTKEDIHKHPRSFYAKLMSYLEWEIYPGEAQLIERGLYYLWN